MGLIFLTVYSTSLFERMIGLIHFSSAIHFEEILQNKSTPTYITTIEYTLMNAFNSEYALMNLSSKWF